MLELKEYQSQALEAFERWLRALQDAREESERGVAALQEAGVAVPPEVLDYPRKAWERLRTAGGAAATGAGEHVGRTDGAGRPIPHVCFKVPTGGGKTLLAAAALERLSRPAGLTLWIAPTRAIYAQTKAALWNREHPYRQMLERASGGRVKLLEKETRFTAPDVRNYLCVMLLMLPAANRQKGKEFLRMFRDTGRYPSFFPDGDDALGDGRLLEEHPDLERASENGPVKQSLFNVFKMLRPVVVLDEAHKAYGKTDQASDEFVQSVNRLNPRMTLELTATPNRGASNLLVNISGAALRDEEMIRLPVQVETFQNVEWRHTLAAAKEELDRLEAEAQSLYASEGRYVRPIAVVRVERTGKAQRRADYIHAEDVRESLVANLGVPAEAVRVKSSENDELGGEDLLSELSPVRWIITRAALMEGWDCPFAYVLALLDNTQSQKALTQLTGRVMRMPEARRTGRAALDQCYVYCHNASAGVVVEQVKAGLEKEGLTDLGNDVWGKGAQELQRVRIAMRPEFRDTKIFLPRALHREGGDWVELDYDRHILPEVDWGLLTPHDPQVAQPDGARRESASVDIDELPTALREEDVLVDKTVSVAWFARRLTDIVPNSWQAARLAQGLIDRMREGGLSDDAIFDQRSRQAAALREEVFRQADEQAKAVFERKLREEAVRFDLETPGDNYQLSASYEVPVAAGDSTLQWYGRQLQLNLYEPMFSRFFDSDLERKFAFYLDRVKALSWWHRVAARQRNDYYVRGWRRSRIYPDFVALAEKEYGRRVLCLFETKGEHLADSDDTRYKREALRLLQNAYNGAYRHGSLVIRQGDARGVFELVFGEDDFAKALGPVGGSSSA